MRQNGNNWGCGRSVSSPVRMCIDEKMVDLGVVTGGGVTDSEFV